MKTKTKKFGFLKKPVWIVAFVITIWVFSLSVYAFSGPSAGCTPGNCETPLTQNFTTQRVGVGVTAPHVKLDVDGEVKVGNTSITCDNLVEGGLRYNFTSKELEFCDWALWKEPNSDFMPSGDSFSIGGSPYYCKKYTLVNDAGKTINSTTNINDGKKSEESSICVNGESVSCALLDNTDRIGYGCNDCPWGFIDHGWNSCGSGCKRYTCRNPFGQDTGHMCATTPQASACPDWVDNYDNCIVNGTMLNWNFTPYTSCPLN